MSRMLICRCPVITSAAHAASAATVYHITARSFPFRENCPQKRDRNSAACSRDDLFPAAAGSVLHKTSTAAGPYSFCHIFVYCSRYITAVTLCSCCQLQPPLLVTSFFAAEPELIPFCRPFPADHLRTSCRGSLPGPHLYNPDLPSCPGSVCRHTCCRSY